MGGAGQGEMGKSVRSRGREVRSPTRPNAATDIWGGLIKGVGRVKRGIVISKIVLFTNRNR